MLLKENYTAEHIARLRRETRADPSILERTIFAFGLLEAIRRVNMPFIFKGGTSLLVMLKNPGRLSTDIDIIVEPGTDVEYYINKACEIFPFIGFEENKRKGSYDIVKRHFRFYFISPRTGKEINVLLDVVFEHDPYIKVTESPIRNSLLLSAGVDLSVKLPDKNCILGDKLTAFAPHTIGVPLSTNKELEIIKQLFDCWSLIQEMDDYQMVAYEYERIFKIEAGYRGLEITKEECLKDTISSCICIIGRGAVRLEEYRKYSFGINAITGHVIKGEINGDNAGVYASEVLYLATSILTGKTEYERITEIEKYQNVNLPIKGIKKINRLGKNSQRKDYQLSYAYMIKSLQMLQEVGLYTKSID